MSNFDSLWVTVMVAQSWKRMGRSILSLDDAKKRSIAQGLGALVWDQDSKGVHGSGVKWPGIRLGH